MASSAVLTALLSGLSRQHTIKHPRAELMDALQHLDNGIERWREEQKRLVGRSWLDTSSEAKNCLGHLRGMHEVE
jgi:hypothetical protein